MAERERGNAGCVADLGADAQLRLTALEASVEAAMASQQQQHTHLQGLCGNLAQLADGAASELQVAARHALSMLVIIQRICI